jgi:hypothetical protein
MRAVSFKVIVATTRVIHGSEMSPILICALGTGVQKFVTRWLLGLLNMSFITRTIDLLIMAASKIMKENTYCNLLLLDCMISKLQCVIRSSSSE